MTTGTKVCPYCGSTMFAAKIIFPGAVQAMNDGTFKIVSEKKDKQIVEIAMCARCRHEVTEDKLVYGVTCKECGKVTNPSDMTEDGVCDVCKAKKERAELANASQEDLIKMIIEMEKAAKGISATGCHKTSSEDLAETSSESADEPATKKTSRTKKRAKRDTAEDNTQAEEASARDSGDATNETHSVTVETNEPAVDVDALATQQCAPFPDTANTVAEDITGVGTMDTPNMPTSPIVPANSDPMGIGNFSMYESEETF